MPSSFSTAPALSGCSVWSVCVCVCACVHDHAAVCDVMRDSYPPFSTGSVSGTLCQLSEKNCRLI